MPTATHHPSLPRSLLIRQIVPVGAFVLIGALAMISMYLLGGIRAYVGGESIWSKAHFTAVAHLRAHVHTGDPRHMSEFAAALIPQAGDQLARETLQARPVRWDVARQGFRAGGLHPDDINAMLLLHHLFSQTWLFQPSLQAWARGDALFAELRQLAERSRQLSAEQRRGPQAQALLQAIDKIDQRLLTEELTFLRHLTDSAHAAEHALYALIAFAVGLLSIVYVLTHRRMQTRERKHARALRNEQLRWETAMTSAELGCFDLDLATQTYRLDARAAQLLGRGPQDTALSREEFRQHIHPDDRKSARQTMDTAIEQGTFGKTRYRIVTPQGEVRHIEGVGRLETELLPGAHILGTLRDISIEHTQALLTIERDTAQRTAQAQRSFLSRLSHELRTPLNAILGFSQLLELDNGDAALSPKQRQHIAWILQSGRHLLNLVDEVLDLSKIESGQVPLHPQDVDIVPLLRNCLPIVDALRERMGLSLHDELPHGPLHAWADPQRLQQVFLNLLSNACKYNRPGGSVRVGIEQDGERLRIEVADTGLGLSPDEIAQLFQPFQRIERLAQSAEGTGLGLHIARQLMQRMGGNVTAQSPAPGQTGQGACFTIELGLRPQSPSSDNH